MRAVANIFPDPTSAFTLDAPYRYSRVMGRRGGEPREAPRTRLFITLGRRRFGLRPAPRGNWMTAETRVGPATNRRTFHKMDGTRVSSWGDAPAVETNTPEVGR